MAHVQARNDGDSTPEGAETGWRLSYRKGDDTCIGLGAEDRQAAPLVGGEMEAGTVQKGATAPFAGTAQLQASRRPGRVGGGKR